MAAKPIFKNSWRSIIAIAIIVIFQIHALQTQDDFVGKPRWQNAGVIQWDVKEYYQYLPAAIIYHDLAFKFLDTLNGTEANHFWVGKAANGKRIGRFSIGMAVAYTPFFLLGHQFAKIKGAKQNGYSDPYQFCIYISGFIYCLVGFIFLVMSLRKFFSDLISAITILCLGIGTNLFYYTTTEGGMSHAVLFCLYAIFLFFMIKWHKNPHLKYLVPASLVFALSVLIRPTTILVSLIFLLYGISDKASLVQKWKLLKDHSLQFLFVLLVLGFAALPQLLYWKQQTDSYIYYSYSGERFFFLHPRLWNGLFSFRKGWLIYTPMAGLAITGLLFLKHAARALFVPICMFIVLNIYLVLSWWCWWYGGGFGLRAFIESYIFLAMPLAAFWQWCFKKGWIYYGLLGLMSFFFIRINLFQSRQYREGMLHWDSMSKEMYVKQFMRLGYQKDAEKMLDPPDYEAARKGLSEKKPDENHK